MATIQATVHEFGQGIVEESMLALQTKDRSSNCSKQNTSDNLISTTHNNIALAIVQFVSYFILEMIHTINLKLDN